MIYADADNIRTAVKQVYVELVSNNINPADPDLEREDSAVIVIRPGKTKIREAVHLSDGLLDYSYKYARLFPFTKEMITFESGDIVSFEMDFWNQHLLHPIKGAPDGRLKRLIDLLHSDRNSKRAIVDLWDGDVHESSQHAPCLTHLTFRTQHDGVEMHAHLRANDICFLLFMDMQVMSGVHRIVADSLRMKKGRYVQFIDSVHYRKKYVAVVKKQYHHILNSQAWMGA